MHVLAPFDLSLEQSTRFLLLLPSQPFLGLDGEVNTPPLFVLIWLSRLAYDRFGLFLEGVHPS